MVFLTLFSVFLVSIFIFGQIFYYKNMAAATIRDTRVVANNKLATNLTTTLQQNFILKYREKDSRVSSDE